MKKYKTPTLKEFGKLHNKILTERSKIIEKLRNIDKILKEKPQNKTLIKN